MTRKNEKKKKRRPLKKKKQTMPTGKTKTDQRTKIAGKATGNNGMKVAMVTITDVPWECIVLFYFLYRV